jgi:hypothetical protein
VVAARRHLSPQELSAQDRLPGATMSARQSEVLVACAHRRLSDGVLDLSVPQARNAAADATPPAHEDVRSRSDAQFGPRTTVSIAE